MVVSVFYKKLESRGWKTNRKFQHVNKSFRISSNKGLSRDWSIRLVNNKKGGGDGGLKEREIINFLPLNSGGGGEVF